ncbi:flagellar protein FlaG [Bacillus sp. ISL-35]|uniref:flagellar protein FlaG n=1 Tax=Bacillus sp. ISL-35 TaxID=2819122 RepID=UPI001BEC816C|nr:flagellar protein FlaG [Bacillus sp. ISL-35]MBT2678865.1 flagellar protein FlaG [Bacillus sp. ISL-35]MBT2703857.1 flagellar protein FlaG [Chryseobacterium sp. ISL-80]
MIERLSSNPISSQLRTNNNSEITNQTQGIDLGLFKELKEQNQEHINLPKEKVKEIVDTMNKFMEASPTALKFEFHEELNEYFVKIIDEKTKEVVREIPPKKMLDFYAAMNKFIGLMVDKKI